MFVFDVCEGVCLEKSYKALEVIEFFMLVDFSLIPN